MIDNQTYSQQENNNINESKNMIENEKYIAAIDIGTTKIVAIIGAVSDDGKVRILGIGRSISKGVKRGVVLNIEETAASIQEAVYQAQQTSKLTFDEVYVGIAGQHIKSIKNRHSKYIQSVDGEITQADLDELRTDMHNISMDAGEEIIHVIPQNYTVDNECGVKQPVGMFGKRLEANFHIVVGEISSAKHIHKCIQRSGLKVKQMILEPLASASAVLTPDEKEIGVAMVDIGGGTTDIAIYYDGILRHTAVIPFGSDVITRDIKEGCSILHRQAEKIKVQFGTALADAAPEEQVVSVPGISGREPKLISIRFLSKIIQARMEEIIDYIAFEIENSGFANKLGAGITITGGGALLRHIRQLMSYKTSLDVNIGYPSRSLLVDNPDINSPIFSTSIGLLLNGYAIDKEKAKEIKLKPEAEEVKEEDEEEETDENMEENNSPRPKEKLINFFKESLSNFFEDKGSKM
jgi:cell division protein FtsA